MIAGLVMWCCGVPPYFAILAPILGVYIFLRWGESDSP